MKRFREEEENVKFTFEEVGAAPRPLIPLLEESVDPVEGLRNLTGLRRFQKLPGGYVLD